MILESVSSAINVGYYQRFEDKYCPTIYQEINSYTPKTATPPPQELIEFRALKNTTIEDRAKFFGQIFIKEYLDSKWEVELHNRDCFLRLHELSQKTEAKEKEAVMFKSSLFLRTINNSPDQYPALKIDMKKHNVSAFQDEWD